MQIADIAKLTIGLDTHYQLADGTTARRVYLDSAASALRLSIADKVINALLPHYANTHTQAHFSAKICNHEYEKAHDTVLDFVHADKTRYSCIFMDSGTTAALNRAAYNLRQKFPQKDVAIVSVMEHHSNDLPHRKHFDHVVHAPTTDEFGCIDLVTLETILKQFNGRVNYIAVSGVSNVTGIINPIYDIAEIAHRYDAKIIVDAAQMAPHMPLFTTNIKRPEQELDVVCFAAHKIYCPGGPGVLVARNTLFADIEPLQMGGGMVDDVYSNRFVIHDDITLREEAGTPNIIGAIALAAVLKTLNKVGMQEIAKHDHELITHLLNGLSEIKDVRLYGDLDTKHSPRTGAVAFNITGLHHGLTAAILNDYFNIAVRNACFCAHPYVRELVTEDMENYLEQISEPMDNAALENMTEETRGMVRASLGVYNNKKDIDTLINAIKDICANKENYAKKYYQVDKNTFQHNDFHFVTENIFNSDDIVQQFVNTLK